jgi:hypothetical protein
MKNVIKTPEAYKDLITDLAAGEEAWCDHEHVWSDLRDKHPDKLDLIEEIEDLAGDMSNLAQDIDPDSTDFDKHAKMGIELENLLSELFV